MFIDSDWKNANHSLTCTLSGKIYIMLRIVGPREPMPNVYITRYERHLFYEFDCQVVENVVKMKVLKPLEGLIKN